MEFKINVKIKDYPFKISYNDKIFSIGSCFSQEMSNKLEASKFRVFNNPFGVVFHPNAIENTFNRIKDCNLYEPSEICKNQDFYFSWDHSSIFNTSYLDDTLLKINNALKLSNKTFNDSNIFIITLATSWVYQLTGKDKIVSNCHKVPSNEFQKKLLPENEIENSLISIVNTINNLPQENQIIFTVSPVRHLRDGLTENSVSKSRLLNAVYKLTQTIDNVYYFPSYEILIDELRDYRFYKEDMIHPSPQAIEYIWKKFSNSFFTESTQEIVNKVWQLKKAEDHIPINTKTIAHKKFIEKTIEEMQELEKIFGENSFKNEIDKISQNRRNND